MGVMAADLPGHMCLTRFNYEYVTLSWKTGAGNPKNPSCVKVEVFRVFTTQTELDQMEQELGAQE